MRGGEKKICGPSFVKDIGSSVQHVMWWLVTILQCTDKSSAEDERSHESVSLHMTAWVLQKCATLIVFLRDEIAEVRDLSFVHSGRTHDFWLHLAQCKRSSTASWNIAWQIYPEHPYRFFQQFKIWNGDWSMLINLKVCCHQHTFKLQIPEYTYSSHSHK